VSNAAEIITYPQTTIGGKVLKMSRRTAAHLDYTKKRLAAAFPGARLFLIQGTYNDDVPASAGTHDKDCAFDVVIVGLTWLQAQRFLRACGWAAWYRPERFDDQGNRVWIDHIHMISLGYRPYLIPVGDLIPGQVVDYFEKRNGLVDHAPDPTWHPPSITATIFDFEAWEKELEDAMPYNDWPQADKDALVADVVKGMLAAEVRKKSATQNALNAKAAWRKSAEAAEKP
jgi:hypothetical protein